MAYVSSSGLNIYYESRGEGNPTLLMLHGNGNSVKDWHSLGYVMSTYWLNTSI
jgi:pimeloyl-ACP methyl ester carboxylesterase